MGGVYARDEAAGGTCADSPTNGVQGPFVVVFQYHQRKQLAWQGRADYFLDGQALVAADRVWLCNRGCGGRRVVVDVEYVVYAGEDECGQEMGAVEKGELEGEVSACGSYGLIVRIQWR